jgi:hypothetical protein
MTDGSQTRREPRRASPSLYPREYRRSALWTKFQPSRQICPELIKHGIERRRRDRAMVEPILVTLHLDKVERF